MSEGSSFAGSLTLLPTAVEVITSAGTGPRSPAGSSPASHATSLSRPSTAGIREWTCATRVFAAVVTMTKDPLSWSPTRRSRWPGQGTDRR